MAIFRKDMREFRRNKQIISTMAISPVGFLVFPVIFLFAVPASDASTLYQYPVLLFTLAMAALVPVTVGAYSITGEREQGTLEPVLGTPVLAGEFLLGKALAALIPTVAISYAMYGIFLCVVAAFAHQNVASEIFQAPRILAQLLFTPLLAGWSIWAGIAVSARSSDVRVAQQIGTLASLPPLALTALMGFGVIQPTLTLALILGAVLLVIDLLAWRLVATMFNRERLITGSKATTRTPTTALRPQSLPQEASPR